MDASRVVFAFARDNALPGSQWLKRIHPWTQTPMSAVWFVMVGSALCGLLGFSAAALTSLAGFVFVSHPAVVYIPLILMFFIRASVISLYISYAVPILLRITWGRDRLAVGPFSLGKWYMPIGTMAVSWVVFITVLLLFPSSQVTTSQSMSVYIDLSVASLDC